MLSLCCCRSRAKSNVCAILRARTRERNLTALDADLCTQSNAHNSSYQSSPVQHSSGMALRLQTPVSMPANRTPKNSSSAHQDALRVGVGERGIRCAEDARKRRSRLLTPGIRGCHRPPARPCRLVVTKTDARHGSFRTGCS